MNYEHAGELAIRPKKAALFLDVSEKTILREIHRGNLRALKIGRQWRIRVAELHAYLHRKENQKRK